MSRISKYGRTFKIMAVSERPCTVFSQTCDAQRRLLHVRLLQAVLRQRYSAEQEPCHFGRRVIASCMRLADELTSLLSKIVFEYISPSILVGTRDPFFLVSHSTFENESLNRLLVKLATVAETTSPLLLSTKPQICSMHPLDNPAMIRMFQTTPADRYQSLFSTAASAQRK